MQWMQSFTAVHFLESPTGEKKRRATAFKSDHSLLSYNREYSRIGTLAAHSFRLIAYKAH